MTPVIVVGALGVIISITEGLFLRRLLGQLAELRRQITGIDRQMRAQRARVTFLRQLITDGQNEDKNEDGPTAHSEVVTRSPEETPDLALQSAHGPEPVRRKKHLGLYPGGAAAVTIVAPPAPGSPRTHRSQIACAITGSAIAAAAATMATVPPWVDDADHTTPPTPAVSAAATVHAAGARSARPGPKRETPSVAGQWAMPPSLSGDQSSARAPAPDSAAPSPQHQSRHLLRAIRGRPSRGKPERR